VAQINVPTAQGSTVLELENGYLLAPEGEEGLFPGGAPAIDLFAQVKGNVTEAVDYILNLSSQGASE
jgi:hypothetical protein